MIQNNLLLAENKINNNQGQEQRSLMQILIQNSKVSIDAKYVWLFLWMNVMLGDKKKPLNSLIAYFCKRKGLFNLLKSIFIYAPLTL